MIDKECLFAYLQDKFVCNLIIRYKKKCLVKYFLNRTFHIKAQDKNQNSSTNCENVKSKLTCTLLFTY